MKCSVLLAVLLSLLFASAFALTEGEKSALSGFLQSIPDLGAVSPPWTANVSSACTPPSFYGVRCSNDSDPHVVAIKLEYYDGLLKLNGSIPEEVGNLSWLEVLSLSNICLQGSMPRSLGSLTNLTTLELSLSSNPALMAHCNASSPFTASMPDSLMELRLLETLLLRSTDFEGLISKNLGQLTSLKSLSLELTNTVKTSWMGPLPTSIAQCTQLKELFLRRTKVSGFGMVVPPLPSLESLNIELSTEFRALLNPIVRAAPNLVVLIARGSGLSGSASDLGSLVNLSVLDLSMSQVSGMIPPEFWNLTKLTTIDFSATNLMTFLSSHIGGMTSLRNLYLPPATFGAIPESIGNCTELELIFLTDAKGLTGSLPDALGNLTKLKNLGITRSYLSGTIPAALCNSLALEWLTLSQNLLTGTLPPCMAQLTQLRYLSLSFNSLEGPIPDFGFNLTSLGLSSNRFTGTVPSGVARKAESIYLEDNLLGPYIDPQAFADNAELYHLTLTNNRFGNCSLPEIPSNLPHVDMSGNEFVGSIPWSWRNARSIDLARNKLTGGWDHLLLQVDPNSHNRDSTSSSETESPILAPKAPNIVHLHAEDNQFSGTLPQLSQFTNLETLDISKNQWTGPLPALPLKLFRFAASKNLFKGPLSDDFLQSLIPSTNPSATTDSSITTSQATPPSTSARKVNKVLSFLDLSNNTLECPMSDSHFLGATKLSKLLTADSLEFLSLAMNNISCDFSFTESAKPAPLVSLDLSSNHFSGLFPFTSIDTLMSMKLSNNDFRGEFSIWNFPLLTLLDISNNKFSGEIEASYLQSPFLVSYNARNNLMTGSVSFERYEFRNLESMDVSANHLDGKIDMASISLHFRDYSLQSLKIDENLHLEHVDAQSIESNALTRTSSSSPAIGFEGGVCYDLRFGGIATDTFIYDEHLFNYWQCDCDSDHYGVPQNCLPCPSQGIDFCGHNNFTSDRNWFAFEGTSDKGEAIITTESCAYSAAQQIIGKTNCRGVSVLFLISHNSSLSSTLAPQCEPGSDGRLCSRCICDAENPSENCWFEKGATCAKCRFTVKSGVSIGIFFAAYFFVLIIATGIMFAILRSKRTKSTVPWPRLPLFNRVFFRFLYLTSLGNVSITINFVQLLAALTNWDSYVLRGFLQLLNGSPESFGLRCVFPILADPMASLLIKLFTPVFFILTIAVSIGLAELLSRKINQLSRQKNIARQASNAELAEDWVPLLTLEPEVHYVPYPAMALFTSMAMAMAKFFYFGTAIAAHEYIFSSIQPNTGVKYVQNQPWMKYRDASSLIGVSVPAILIYDLFLPVSFVLLCVRLRRIFNSPDTTLYLGSLFSSFSRRCFWWEIVNILKKLLIALLLQGIPSSSATQSTLILSVLAGTQIVQLSLAPWKRKTENLFDAISAVLLIGSLQSVRSTHLSESSGSIYYLLSLDMLFVAASVATIGYETWTGQTDYQKSLDPNIFSKSLASNEGSLFSQESEGEGPSQEEMDDGLLDPSPGRLQYSSASPISIESSSEDETFETL